MTQRRQRRGSKGPVFTGKELIFGSLALLYGPAENLPADPELLERFVSDKAEWIREQTEHRRHGQFGDPSFEPFIWRLRPDLSEGRLSYVREARLGHATSASGNSAKTAV